MSSSVTATFAFTDLVDSTAIAARLEQAAAEELRQTHFRLLRGAVSGSGGTEVKNLGDGLMVMYSSPSRALAGAVGMQQALEHHNRSGGHALSVRIGISAGEAVEEDGDYFGDPVVEAARLCASADGGQILAAEVVRLMVGRHATQTFVEVGPLELKGIPQPVDAVEVQWDPVAVAAGSVPLPGRLVGAASDALFGFFGRGPELAELEDARKRAHSAQRCQAVFVAGEAGIGKTAILAQHARAAHDQGAVVLFGHADEDLGVAYQPWIEVASTVVRHGDADVVAGLRPAQLAALARLVPEVGGESDRVGDPDTERLLLLEGTTELLAATSRRYPVIVVLDDLHWADTASLQLLRHLIASSVSMDVTIACSYRDTDLGRRDPLTKLLADLHREANVARVALRGLEDHELVELMAAAAGHDLDDTGVGLAHALRRETDGNPFFTAEILRHLGETGAIVLGDDGRWTTSGDLEDLGLPSSVRDVVGRRVERLGEEALRVLSLAAVIGREFGITTLALLADMHEESLLDLMDAAVAAAVLVETPEADRYRFAHALIQHTLYEELSPTRRQRAHQRIGQALEADTTTRDDPAVLADLARHWIAATRPADLDKAVHYARRAGDAAAAALAPDDAIRWYQQALDLLARQATPNEHQRVELLVVLGAAQRHAGHPEYRHTLLQAASLAEQLDDTDVLVEAALGFRMAESLVGDTDTKQVAAAALERVGTDPTPVRAELLAVLASAHDAALESETRRDLALQAVDAARRSGDEAAFVNVIGTTNLTLATPDRHAENIEDTERAVMLADRIADPVLQVNTRFNLFAARCRQCDLDGADRLLAEMEAIVERVGLPYQGYQVAMVIGGRATLAGRLADAETATAKVLELGSAAGSPDTFGAYGGLLYNIRWHQGRLDEIADLFLDAARDNPSIAALRAAVPMLLCELGRVDEACDRLAAEAATGFDFPFDGLWLTEMHDLLDAVATTEDRVDARTLVDSAAPFATHVVAPGPSLIHGAMARPLARAATVLGEYDQAEEWFTLAHDIHARLQAPFRIALGQLDHTDLCLARHADDDLVRARQLTNTAAATAAEFGYAGLARRAARLLALT
jgi:class 3 adenylate cyclase/tetratricopeptide (TPR) repeat protein